MRMTYETSIQQVNIPKKVNSILKHRSTYGGKHGSEDSDSEEDEIFRKKFINFESGHGMLISPDTFSTHLDLSKSRVQDQKYYKDLVFKTDNVLYPKDTNDGSTPNSRKASLKYVHSNTTPMVPLIDLDSIQMNNDREYGFNPNRPNGSKGDYRLLLRPISLYSPRPEREKSALKYSNSDADEKYSIATSSRRETYAKNDIEYDLEKELTLIREKPCNLTFQGCEGKINQQEFADDLASSRRNRKIRRQLSFDSHPNRNWHKTLSLDSGLATDSYSKQSFKKEKSKSQTLLDIDESDSLTLKGLKRLSFSAEFILVDELTPVSTPDDDVDAESAMKIVVNNNASNLKILPKFVDDRPPTEDILLSTESNSYSMNKPEKLKRRSNIPHILSAFRLPNKKLKKLIKRRSQDGRNSPLRVSHDINPNVTLVESRKTDSLSIDEHGPGIVASMGTDNKSFLESVNTFERKKKDETSLDIEPADLSKSTHSLQKVDEDKESLEFKSPFDHRRSKSSCSITINKTPGQQSNTARRMSDTNIEKPYIGHSPSKRFIRKIFSPVVCGLPSPDKHGYFNGSLSSLRSYDSGSNISETDDSPQLFDFGSHELMEEMTQIDKELLIRIPWGELSILGWMSPDKMLIASNVMKMVQFFNRVVMMVTTSILAEENVYRRAKVIQKAIKLALKFRYQKNFNSLKAVLGGLQCTPVFRLKQTWKQVPSRYRRVFRELSELMSEENNFYNYRVELQESMKNPPCIPFLGNFLTTVAHTHAYVACHLKYKNSNKKDTEKENEDSDGSSRTSPSPVLSPLEIEGQGGSSEDLSPPPNELDNKQVDPCLQSSSSKIHSASHMRTDSDDSGVVLNVHRLSRASDDLEPSPREGNLSSPDDDGRCRYEDVFNNKKNLNDNTCNTDSKSSSKHHFSDGDSNATLEHQNERLTRSSDVVTETRHRRSVSEVIMSPTRHGRSISVDNAGILLKRVNDIANLINNRPVEGKADDELYGCELQFWKYQIASVQYKIIPKSYIRRYLMNCPYNTEEENYRLSLRREPPCR